MYDTFYAMVEKYVGLQLNDSKKYLVDSRLSSMANRSGYSSVHDFVQYLVNASLRDTHWQAFEALLTNETSFFRDGAVFEALSDHILPLLIQKKKNERALRICCLASSTGQEVYSLCMLLKERFPELAQWSLYIQASDISTQALDQAKRGIYNQREVERGLPTALLNRYFSKLPDGRFQISQTLRSQVNFLQQNLLDECPSFPKYDLVMLRNVLIYFGQDMKNKILSQIHRTLIPDSSILMLGATESIHANPLYRLVPLGRVSYYHSLP